AVPSRRMDLGPPGSYMTLEPGVPVYSSDGRHLGTVEHVLAEPDKDIFDGIVIDRSVLPGGHRFVDAPEVGEIHERGVVLALDATAAERLPEPSDNPATMSASPDDTAEGELERKLRRAWDLISGNY
ncbi:MAG: hypothetical protein ACRDSN_06470, partial [Pseudonocardiaceae bacterium]